jgi:hypothetical protein
MMRLRPVKHHNSPILQLPDVNHSAEVSRLEGENRWGSDPDNLGVLTYVLDIPERQINKK